MSEPSTPELPRRHGVWVPREDYDVLVRRIAELEAENEGWRSPSRVLALERRIAELERDLAMDRASHVDLSEQLLDARERITELEAKIAELTKVQDPCPECGENLIPLQRGSTKWSCKNHHTVERK